MKRIVLATLAFSMFAAPAALAQKQQNKATVPNDQLSSSQTANASARPTSRSHWSRGDIVPNWEDYPSEHANTPGLWEPDMTHRWIKVGDEYLLISKIFGKVADVVLDR